MRVNSQKSRESRPATTARDPVSRFFSFMCRRLGRCLAAERRTRLAKDFSVYAPDTLGHGFTGSGDYKSGPPQPAMVEHLGLSSTILASTGSRRSGVPSVR